MQRDLGRNRIFFFEILIMFLKIIYTMFLRIVIKLFYDAIFSKKKLNT